MVNAMKEKIRRILVVDDELGVSTVLTRYIQGAGCDVRTAGSAEDAIGLAGNEDFDLILLDIVLPGISGFGAIEALKRKCDAAIIIMTGYDAEEFRKDAELLGAIGIIEKPVEFQKLLRIIRWLPMKSDAMENVHETENLNCR